MLPVVTSLCGLADAEASRLADEGQASLAAFARVISQEITSKFCLSPVDECSLRCVATALDPRSRSLAFLPADSRGSLKQDILQRCSAFLTSDSAPEPLAKRVPPTEDAISLFFGSASDEEVSQSVQLEKGSGSVLC